MKNLDYAAKGHAPFGGVALHAKRYKKRGRCIIIYKKKSIKCERKSQKTIDEAIIV
jgi:hypothetical protein